MAQTSENKIGSRIFGGDPVIWIIFAILAVFSIPVIYSSTASMAYKNNGGDMSVYIGKQVSFLILGFVAMFVTHRIKYQVYYRFIPLLFIFSLGLMALTFFIGTETNEARRALSIPGFGTFQPSDLLKITTVMMLAKALSRRQATISESRILPRFNFGREYRAENGEIFWHNTLPLLLPIALSCGIVMFSNLSTAILIFAVCFLMLFMGRVKKWELWKLLTTTVVAGVTLIAVMYAFDVGRAHVWVNRMASFAGVEMEISDPQKQERAMLTKAANENQVRQAEMAIANGSRNIIMGVGPGKSIQRTNLPLAFSDYVYAFIIEEYGIVIAIFILFLFLWLFYRSALVFKYCEKSFPGLLVLGLGSMITCQALANMVVSVGGPVTGLPMPYLSLGGSSVLFTSIMLGMLLGISRQMREQSLEEPKEKN